MTVLCPGCKRAIAIPPEKASVPKLRARCGGCGTVFVVEEATLAVAGVQPVRATPPSPFPAAPTAARTSASAPVSHAAAQARPNTPAPAASRPAAAGTPTATPHARPDGVSAGQPRPAGATRAATPSATATAGAAAGASIRRCGTHPQAKAESVCPACKKGYCHDCGKKVQNAFVCPNCDGLCVTLAEQEAREAKARSRARSMRDELPVILRYPLVDPVAYGMLSVFVWIFMLAASLAMFGGGFGVLFSQGVLLAYSFTAVNRVSTGNLTNYMPEIGNIEDLALPMRLGFAALLISAGPLFALSFFFENPFPLAGGSHAASAAGVVHAQVPSPPPGEAEPGTDDDEEEAIPGEAEASPSSGESPQPGGAGGLPDAGAAEAADSGSGLSPLLAGGLFALALLWYVFYAPIALTVAAISRSFLTTLNPLVGIDSISKMGSVYWQAMAIYAALTLAKWVLGLLLSAIPFAGTLLKAFVDSYAFLAIGCTLGLAVFKRSPELGFD